MRPDSALFEMSVPPFVSFGHTGDYARLCKGSVVRQVRAAATDDRFRVAIEGEWLRLSLREAAEEYRLDRALHFLVTPDEHVLGGSLGTLRLVFRGIHDETSSLPVLTTSATHRDWFLELSRKLQEAALPIPVKLEG